MADDAALRRNRLALLEDLRREMNRSPTSRSSPHEAHHPRPRRRHQSRQPAFIKSPDEWKPIPGSLEAIARLNQAGYRVVVATNQSGVGRGLFDMATLNAIHDKMHRALAQAGGRIDGIFYCPHAQDADCSCRKPKPGLLEEIARRFNVSLDGVPAIGDSLRDLQAAAAVGAQPILVLTGKGKTNAQGRRPAGRHGGLCRSRRSRAQPAAMMAIVALRSSLFAAFQLLITPFFAIIALLTFPLPALTRYRIITVWTRWVMWAARVICGIRYRVIGAEHIPQEPCVILSKHQSAWETMAFQLIFPPQVWVLKRELLLVPFFGWGLAMLSPIAIDRSSRRKALQQLVEQGRQRLAAGFCIVIFPEGTRVAPGRRGKYQRRRRAPGHTDRHRRAAGRAQCRPVLAAQCVSETSGPDHRQHRRAHPSRGRGRRSAGQARGTLD